MLEVIDVTTGEGSPQLVCGKIQKKLENQIASLYYDYSKDECLKLLSEVMNESIRSNSIDLNVNDNGANAISTNINIQLATIASKYQIHFRADIPSHGAYVNCMLTPTMESSTHPLLVQ